MKVISYAVFGYNQNLKGGFPFASYLRGLSMNIRMAEILFPDWKIHLVTDGETYSSPYKELFDYHIRSEKLILKIEYMEPLTHMMLKRMIPVFDERYDRVICRDTDSLLCYRERQAVDYWIQSGRVVHAITDSISHNTSLMGGMIGFMCKEFRQMVHSTSFEAMIKKGRNMDWSRKGCDQDFLRQYILPLVANDMCEHYVLGMKQSFRGCCFNEIQDIVIQDIKPELKESNHLVEHIGQAGFIVEPILKFLDKHQTQEQKEYYKKIDSLFKDIHYWLL